jgi:hypothetical protein
VFCSTIEWLYPEKIWQSFNFERKDMVKLSMKPSKLATELLIRYYDVELTELIVTQSDVERSEQE